MSATDSEKRISIPVRLRPAERDQLEAVARQNERSMGAEIRVAVTRHLGARSQAA